MTQTGILLINTGSPNSPSVPDVRRYLREFLMDGRVIDLPIALRAAIVYGCILPFRPRRSARAYRKIWTGDGSPLVFTSQRLRDKLQSQLQQPVEVAMRYGNPSVEHALAQLGDVQRVLVFPMFPHYAMSSYESAVVNVREVAAKRRPELEVAVAPPYYDDPRYIDALVSAARPELSRKPDHVLFSFHGMPVRHLEKAKPVSALGTTSDKTSQTSYAHQSAATVQAFLKRSGWREDCASIAYQSRLGPDRWLEPHTSMELQRLARNGVRRLAVMCPSFTADCLETLEEIAMRGRRMFFQAGGVEFNMIPALNDRPEWVNAITEIVRGFELRNSTGTCTAIYGCNP
jgi:protoporphyrin/coproporphyrin ferrochelatase